jgi:hypothetical protein
MIFMVTKQIVVNGWANLLVTFMCLWNTKKDIMATNCCCKKRYILCTNRLSC